MSTSELPPSPTVLNVEQLHRIQATHRGYLYQHLYASGCLLIAKGTGVREVLVERDEDVELRFDDGHTYVQVKTRSDPLVPSDIASAMERFDSIRALHEPGPHDVEAAVDRRRRGRASFAVVANMPPGPKLANMLTSSSWPSDVQILWPGSDNEVPEGLPPAWADVDEGFSWCVKQGEAIQFSRVLPETLVWKLAALVQAAAMGGVGTAGRRSTFMAAELPDLFEQVVRALQELPVAPDPYWPHDDEPIPVSDTPVRLLLGPTGSGKTSWASVSATHDLRPHAYFSARGSEGGVFLPALARELAARFAGNDSSDLATVLMPGASGLDALRALGLLLRHRGATPVVVVDDAQVLNPDDVLRAIGVVPEISWILLAHPGPTADHIVARLGVESETLKGWSLDTIAGVLRSHGSPADARTCDRVRTITGGVPLFVRAFAAQARRTGNDPAEICDQCERGRHLERTAQEVLLADTLAALNKQARALAELLGIADLPLNGDEVAKLAATVGLLPPTVTAGLRTLISWGIAQQVPGERVRLHDAFRLSCNGSSGIFESGAITRLLGRLTELLAASMPTSSVERLARYLEVLPQVGAVELLIEIVANESERLQELGLAPRLLSILEQIAADPMSDADARFWALDSLAFWAMQDGRHDDAAEYVDTLVHVASGGELEERQKITLHIKQLLVAGYRGDARAAKRIYEEILRLTQDDAITRVARYDYAVALMGANHFSSAEAIARDLSLEYYDVVGLDPKWVFRKNTPEIAAALADQPHVLDDLKRLADTLDMYARARRAQDKPYVLARIHAMKFYSVSGAYRSAIRAGQDVADDMVGMGDLSDALSFIENTLIPSVADLGLTEHVVPVRAQYAVVLAYNGKIAEARAEMAKLLAFRGASPDAQTEIENQADLINAIAAGQVKPPGLPDPPPATRSEAPSEAPPKKAGRNDLCPCGSGVKYKRCCGD